MDQDGLKETKARARKAAFARRQAVHSEARSAAGVAHLLSVVMDHKGKVLSGYMPIRTEITPVPVMAAMSAHGPVCVPVIGKPGEPLRFALWTPECEMVEGAFGAFIPATRQFVEPEVLIVPLLAFDRKGGRLGYGGGFYDRTLEGLRDKRPTLAIGYAYSGQEVDAVPLEPTDQLLDAIVTEDGVHWV
ncbi:5-formyltetrahydrofolate cyclo-ligase [Aliiroseovarius zhejiangensis]|uniref:5-formyltetrahydrofolate cyclo-ligase n=1 Tax=Aliiroseovarius zhejiangensis TaxID=1632025 RepID=A0ABQ3J0R4_9RHOB|nr:5-formyltetrahydrofolate cyclo-ligase [Aliiroseovarius zhejiangensis]GHF00244.1 5-formyltetrahydrofolate cyclo-ligase [Aliiroseovarius zhejiangensis]